MEALAPSTGAQNWPTETVSRTTLDASHRRRGVLVQLLRLFFRLTRPTRRNLKFVHFVTQHPPRDMQSARGLRDHTTGTPQRLFDGPPLQVFGDLRQIQPGVVE